MLKILALTSHQTDYWDRISRTLYQYTQEGICMIQ